MIQEIPPDEVKANHTWHPISLTGLTSKYCPRPTRAAVPVSRTSSQTIDISGLEPSRDAVRIGYRSSALAWPIHRYERTVLRERQHSGQEELFRDIGRGLHGNYSDRQQTSITAPSARKVQRLTVERDMIFTMPHHKSGMWRLRFPKGSSLLSWLAHRPSRVGLYTCERLLSALTYYRNRLSLTAMSHLEM